MTNGKNIIDALKEVAPEYVESLEQLMVSYLEIRNRLTKLKKVKLKIIEKNNEVKNKTAYEFCKGLYLFKNTSNWEIGIYRKHKCKFCTLTKIQKPYGIVIGLDYNDDLDDKEKEKWSLIYEMVNILDNTNRDITELSEMVENYNQFIRDQIEKYCRVDSNTNNEAIINSACSLF